MEMHERSQDREPRMVSYSHVNGGFDGDHSEGTGEDRNIVDMEEFNNAKNKVQHGTNGDTNFQTHRRPERPAVVKIRNAVKQYGSGGPLVLNNFGMTVEHGTIYSLLGSSGCGKTTVLTCILGMRHIKKGMIKIFGETPGTPECGVPGNRVGYMPQDLSLYGNFTIGETLRYYGTLCGMKSDDIKKNRDFLIPFLDLPDQSRFVDTLSGGQKRRVSMSVALIHKPELLILDEPTVGVDALLREKIWNYLVELVAEQKTTVIITTHYIEEARTSDRIGLMRGGRLLAENDPTSLMKQHNALLLEDIVLKLCRNDKFDDDHCFTPQEEDYDSVVVTSSNSEVEKEASFWNQTRNKPHRKRDTFDRVKALTMKNAFIMWRNILLVLFMILVPSMMIFLVCMGIGNDPRPMYIGLVNRESNLSNCHNYATWLEDGAGEGCDLQYLSCKYLDELPKDIVHFVEFDTEEEATRYVQEGKSWGYLLFPEYFSDDVFVRATTNTIDDETLNGSFVYYRLDMTSKQISGPLKKIFFDSYEEFIKKLLKNCGFNERLGERPMNALEPIYGEDDTDFREFIAPSLLLGFLFFFPLCSSSVQYIYDKKQGTLERARVAGVKTWEIMAAFFITEGVVLLIQSGLTIAIITLVFGIKVHGSYVIVFLLSLSVGLAGVSMGFMFGSFCNEEIQAVLLSMAAFFPNFLLSGLMWPIEGMPIVMQYFTTALPCTFAAEAIRSVVSRGWPITHIKVWPGPLMIFVWIGLYWTVTILIHKIVLSKK